ncbi:helix-turn-helix domain-containing protein [Micromonospora sp. NPDC050417]|uniref:helix-turn-helix domain-containing protein n=1 Tax=Micromonospora sp. NPDC050417 TaxID=3364280 RepID=UPI0037B8096F
MQSSSTLFRARVPIHPRRRRDREYRRDSDERPDHGKYRLRMAKSHASHAVRAAKFGRLVARILTDAKQRGMTIPDIERATGVGKSTIYRWRDGEWSKDPRATQVRAFCDGLGVPYQQAYRLLGWAENGEPQAEPLGLDPDMQEVARRLRDPNTSEAERAEIRSMIRYLARRRGDDDGETEAV